MNWCHLWYTPGSLYQNKAREKNNHEHGGQDQAKGHASRSEAVVFISVFSEINNAEKKTNGEDEGSKDIVKPLRLRGNGEDNGLLRLLICRCLGFHGASVSNFGLRHKGDEAVFVREVRVNRGFCAWEESFYCTRQALNVAGIGFEDAEGLWCGVLRDLREEFFIEKKSVVFGEERDGWFVFG